MSPTEKTKLNEFLSSLDRNERAKLMKRASQLRKSAQRRVSVPSRFEEDEDEAPAPQKKSSSLDECLWRIVSDEGVETPRKTGDKARVVGVAKTTCTVLFQEKTTVVSLKGNETLGVAVGDEVFVELIDEKLNIAGLVARTSVLSRPDVHIAAKERVIAANIEVVVVVVSVVSPPLHPRLIDRYLVAIQRGGSRPVIAVNKTDLAEGEELRKELDKLEPYRALDLPIFECSASQGKGILELREHLKGEIAAFVGHSGVGKSSLINAFDPRIGQNVGEVSEGYGRGTHTTTSSSLIDLGDLRVIDTPGIRSFGLWDLTADDLPLYFPEFALAGRCKFSDCSHVHEPKCAVKEAVTTRQISKARYETYLRIFESLKS